MLSKQSRDDGVMYVVRLLTTNSFAESQMAKAIVLPTHFRFKNLTGKVFGRLTVISYAGKDSVCMDGPLNEPSLHL